MPANSNNGLANTPPLTQTSYRQAVSETVASLRNGYSDQEMADLWGVSKGTVGNAQNKSNDLSALPLLKLGKVFGIEKLDTILALIGGRAVPRDAITLDVSAVPVDVAKALPLLMELFADGHCCKADVRELDRAGVIDTLGRIADMLRQRRTEVRLEAVA